LRQIGTYHSHVPLPHSFIDVAKDYFEYVFKTRLRPRETNPSSEASFCLIKSWLELCNLQHRCYQGVGFKNPTRLIDVSGEQPCLVNTSNDQGPYIALSHCWGEIQPITTTTSSINTHVESVPFDTLPKMFQDAVHITRRLNIKYLWIDSLCIVQDSEEDWAREAAQMGDIYRHAFLTIFALDSKNCHEGIFVQRSPVALDRASNIAEMTIPMQHSLGRNMDGTRRIS
jgi:hypothetical protein